MQTQITIPLLSPDLLKYPELPYEALLTNKESSIPVEVESAAGTRYPVSIARKDFTSKRFFYLPDCEDYTVEYHPEYSTSYAEHLRRILFFFYGVNYVVLVDDEQIELVEPLENWVNAESVVSNLLTQQPKIVNGIVLEDYVRQLEPNNTISLDQGIDSLLAYCVAHFPEVAQYAQTLQDVLKYRCGTHCSSVRLLLNYIPGVSAVQITAVDTFNKFFTELETLLQSQHMTLQ